MVLRSRPRVESTLIHHIAAMHALAGRRQSEYAVSAAIKGHHVRATFPSIYLSIYLSIYVSIYLSNNNNNNNNNNWLHHPGNGILGDVLRVRLIREPYGSQALCRPYPPNPSPPVNGYKLLSLFFRLAL